MEVTSNFDPESGLMPDLRGRSARQAIEVLGFFGMMPFLQGDGFVERQQPEAGSAIERGGSVTLHLNRKRAVAVQ